MDEERPRRRLWIWGAALVPLFPLTFFFLPCVPLPAGPSVKCGGSPGRALLTPLQWMDARPWKRS